MKNAFVILLLASLLGAMGCTSDKHFEKYFSRNGGIWDIATLKWQRVESTITSQTITDGVTTNAGYLTFDESGTCNFNHTLGNFTRVGAAVWSAQDEHIQMVYDSVAGGAPGSMTVSLRIDKNGSDKVSLQGTETWSDDIGTNYSNSLSYELVRRD